MTLCRKLVVLVAGFLVAASVVRGATVQGTVKNGTTGQPAAGVEVVLIQLQGGMTPVLNTKADAQGHFTFDYPSIGAQPMLVRAVYKGVNFHQPLPPGRTDIEVEVFDPSRDPKTVSVESHFVIFQPNGGTLVVGEEYSIKNNSQPPQAYYDEKGNFDFAIPDGATLKQVAAQGPSGMPVVQSPIEKGRGKYSVAYAFRPGDNGVRYSYEMPYNGNAASLKLPTVYPSARLVVVAPPSLQISGDGLQAGGQEQGMSIYDHGTSAPNSIVTVSVSGTAPPPSDAETQSDPGAQGRDAQQGSSAQGASIQIAPGRLDDDLKWKIVAVLVLAAAAFGVILARKPLMEVAEGPIATAAVGELAGSKIAVAATSAAPAKEDSGKAPSPPAQSKIAQVDAAVGSSVDALKDTLFRLELRRQAGTISEEDYAKERARAEKVLRDLVRG
jgi:hypothetical protein